MDKDWKEITELMVEIIKPILTNKDITMARKLIDITNIIAALQAQLEEG